MAPGPRIPVQNNHVSCIPHLTMVLLAMCVLLGGCGNQKLRNILSPDLPAVEKELERSRAELVGLGEPMVTQSVPEFGYMYAPWFGTSTADNAASEWVQVDLGQDQKIDTIALIPVRIDWHLLHHPSFGFPKRFRVEISLDGEFRTSECVASYENVDFPDPGATPLVIPTNGKVARYVRLTIHKPRRFALAELMVLQGNLNIALNCPIAVLNESVTGQRWSRKNLVDGRSPIGLPVISDPVPFDGLYAGMPPDDSPVWMGMDLGSEVFLDEVRLYPIHGWMGIDIPGYAFPKNFRLEVSSDPEFLEPRTIFDSGENYPHPGGNVVTIPCKKAKGRYVRVVLQHGETLIGDRRFGFAEVEIYSQGTNIAPQATLIGTPDSIPTRANWPRTVICDHYTSFGRIVELPEWLRNWTRRKELEQQLAVLNERQVVLLSNSTRRFWILLASVVFVAVVGGMALFFHGRQQRALELGRFRRQLASDLHDEIGSSLAAIAGISENASDYPNDEPVPDFQKINRIARSTTDAMRETLWVAGSSAEMGIDLMEHLQLTSARMLPRCQVVWKSVVDRFPGTWPMKARRELFLFFKEAMANIVRHSRANEVDLSIKADNDWLELEIRDNGKGFQPHLAHSGIGLQSLRHRAATLRGSMEINTQPGAGTHILLKVPMKSRTSPLAKLFRSRKD